MHKKENLFLYIKVICIIIILLLIVILILDGTKKLKFEENKEPDVVEEELSDEEKLRKELYNKNISILGDSISTYKGYSDNLDTNSGLVKGVNCYPSEKSGISNVEQTWWKKVADEYRMNILVNNSLSGSKVSEIGNRVNQLHDDTGDNAGTNPDIIAIYMGINDYNSNLSVGEYSEKLYKKLIKKEDDGSYSYEEPKTFTEHYIIMIHKIINNYEDADIFCLTLIPNFVNEDKELFYEYNKRIRKIAAHYNLSVVDTSEYMDINYDNTTDYSYESNGLHPNEKGMEAIYETFKYTLMKKYVK